MRISFRSLLLLALIVVPLTTVCVVALISHRNASSIVDGLSERVLQQSSDRIHQEVRTLLDEASVVSRVNRAALSGRELSADDLPEILVVFHRLVQEHERFTYLSLGLETGDYGHVYRQPDGELEVRLRRMRPDGRADRTDFRLVDGELVEYRRDIDSYDPRVRPFYGAARRARDQTWPDVYLFSNAPNPDYPGVTCATPIYDSEGDLTGVLTADFDLIALGEFLEELDPFESGEAFVVERRQSGQLRVIAHRDPDVLIGPVTDDGGNTVQDVLPIEQVGDPVIRAFMQRVPARWSERGGGDVTRVEFEVEGASYIGAWRPVIGRHDVRWLTAIVVPEDVLMAQVERSNVENFAIGVASLLLLVIVGFVIAARVSTPLTRLAEETEAIGEFRLEAKEPERTNLTELDRLATSLEEMKAGLRSFGKFVPMELVRSLLESGQEAQRGGERRELTVYFSDLVGFTSIAEKLEPEVLVELLSEYLDAMSVEIRACEGTVDKHIGDAVMAFWGAPVESDSHAVDACRAALSTQARLRQLRPEWAKRGLPELRMRVGLNTGELIVGNIGSDQRLTYTAIGDPVNLASRLEGLNKHFGTACLISQTTFEQAKAHIVARPMDRVSVKGKKQGVVVYELLSMRDGAKEIDLLLADASTRALDAYFERRFEDAVDLFDEVLLLRSADPSATALRTKCLELADRPPPDDWTAVTRMRTK